MTFHEKLTKLLSERQITTHRFSCDLHIPLQRIEHWSKNGTHPDTIDKLFAIAFYLGTSVDELCEGVNVLEEKYDLLEKPSSHK